MPIQSKSLGETGVAVAAGDVITLNAWANTVQSVRAAMNFRPASGDEPVPYVIDLATTSNRALASASVTIVEDGIIDAAAVFFQGLPSVQRGQVYVQLIQASRGIVLAADYVFTGYAVPMGRVTPPGPAGGPGMMKTQLTADPAANAEVAEQSVPSGAIWLLRSYTVQLVQGLTQTPLPTLRFRDPTPSVIAQVPITPTPIGASSTAQLTWGIGLVQTSFTTVVGDEFHTAPLPVIYQPQNSLGVGTITDGIGANSNYGPAALTIEEWVVPN